MGAEKNVQFPLVAQRSLIYYLVLLGGDVVPIRFVTLQLFSAYVSVTVDVDVSRFPIRRQ